MHILVFEFPSNFFTSVLFYHRNLKNPKAFCGSRIHFRVSPKVAFIDYRR